MWGWHNQWNQGKTNIFQFKGIGKGLCKKLIVGEHPAMLMCQGLKKVQSGSPRQIDFPAGQIIFKAYLPNEKFQWFCY